MSREILPNLISSTEWSWFPINESLYQALAQVHEETAAELWVDSICINQDDDLEKSNQCRAWTESSMKLGWSWPEEEGSDGAITMLCDLGDRLLYCLRSSWYFIWYGSDKSPLGEILPLQPFLAEYELDDFSIRPNPLSKLLRRPLWERMWVMQEVSIARSVLLKCGRTTISLGAALHYLPFYQGHSPPA
jgi:hypothetical protein